MKTKNQSKEMELLVFTLSAEFFVSEYVGTLKLIRLLNILKWKAKQNILSEIALQKNQHRIIK